MDDTNQFFPLPFPRASVRPSVHPLETRLGVYSRLLLDIPPPSPLLVIPSLFLPCPRRTQSAERRAQNGENTQTLLFRQVLRNRLRSRRAASQPASQPAVLLLLKIEHQLSIVRPVAPAQPSTSQYVSGHRQRPGSPRQRDRPPTTIPNLILPLNTRVERPVPSSSNPPPTNHNKQHARRQEAKPTLP